MSLKKNWIKSYLKMASVSFLAGLVTLISYNILLYLFGNTEKSLLFSSFFAYITGVVANFFMQAMNGAHQPTARKMLLFIIINISIAALTSIISTYLISIVGLRDDRMWTNVLYSLTVVIMSPITFSLYKIALKGESAPTKNGNH